MRRAVRKVVVAWVDFAHHRNNHRLGIRRVKELNRRAVRIRSHRLRLREPRFIGLVRGPVTVLTTPIKEAGRVHEITIGCRASFKRCLKIVLVIDERTLLKVKDGLRRIHEKIGGCCHITWQNELAPLLDRQSRD